MNNFHKKLSTKYHWYANWHQRQHHGVVHWVMLSLFILTIGFNVFRTIAKPNDDQTFDTVAFGQLNGLRVLGEDEYAILMQPGKASGKMVKQAIVVNGESRTFDVVEGTTMTAFNYEPGTTTYVPTDAPGLTVYTMTDFTGYDSSGKIDTAISRVLKKESKVSVIVRMNIPSRFYDAKDSAATRGDKSQAFANAKASIAQSIGGAGTIKKDLKIINGISIEVSEKALEGLRKNPRVAKVDLDREATAFLDTSVNEINAPLVWPLIDTAGNTLTGTGMRIAIIDTGVDYTHPDLGGCFGATCKVIGGYDFISNDADPMDDNGHGTHVAATAAGNGLLKGVAPDAKILGYKVLNSGGSGSFSGIIAAIDRATDPNQDGNPSDHVDVANMSLGAGCGVTYSSGCGPDDSLSLAVNNSSAAGVIHVIAAGNAGPSASTVGSPGTAHSAITIAASCKSAQIGTSSTCAKAIASFSSRGPVIALDGNNVNKPDIAAPGVSICAARWGTAFAGSPTCFDSQHIRISGTSMATPHMAGVAALMKQANPNYSVAQIKERLKDTATSLSGMTYDEQGAGQADVKKAIPLISQIDTTPFLWNVATDPTQKSSVTTQSFSIKGKDASISSLSLEFTSPVPGIVFTSNKNSLNVANLTTDTFIGTITVDNDVALAGKYNTMLYFVENGVRKGAIPLLITVTPTVTASMPEIDYGINNPSFASWDSEVKQVTLTNTRDIAQTIALSHSPFASDITYQITPTTITVPANGTATFDTRFSVVNTSVSNNIYSGTLSVKNATTDIAIPITFAKFYAVTFYDSNLGDKPSLISFFDPQKKQVVHAYPKSYPFTAYFGTPATYSVSIRYMPLVTNGPEHLVVKDNIVSNGNISITTGRTDAKNKLTVTGTQINGTTNVIPFKYVELRRSSGETSFNSVHGLGESYISDLSTDHEIFVTTHIWTATEPVLHRFGGKSIGLTADWNITNTIADLKATVVQHDVNAPIGSSILPITYGCPSLTGWFCSGNYNINSTKIVPYAQTIYTPISFSGFPFISSADMNATSPHSMFALRSFDIVGGTRRFWNGAISNIPTPIYQGKIYNGLGPTVWFSKFKNSSSKIEITSMLPNNQPITPLGRQDYALNTHTAIPYTVTQNGTSVASGNFAAFNPMGSFAGGYTLVSIPTPANTYTFQTSFPYQNQGKSMTGTVSSTFNTGLSDPNPPSISRLFYFANNARVDVYDATATNRLDVDFDANGGTMATVGLEMSADGGAYTAVPIYGAGTYSATLPALPATTKIALRLTATDAAANSFRYTFELPTGSGGTQPTDTTPPTNSLTVPVNGAILSGSVAITAVATDDVGVDHVDFYRDTTLIGSDQTTPYNIAWDTLTVPNGSYGLTSKAYDAAGNSTASAVAAITVNNTVTPPPDTTIPSVTLTVPTNNTTVSSVITIAATATDNVGVTKVMFYNGATLIDTDTTGSPGYAILWDTATVVDGTYTLTAKAYDATNNTATSTPITVIVDNVIAPSDDIVAPVTSITSPLDKDMVKVKTAINIAATATDNVGIAKVDFYNGSTLLCSDTIAPYVCSWTIPKSPNKKYSLTTKAYDMKGNVGISPTIQITSIR